MVDILSRVSRTWQREVLYHFNVIMTAFYSADVPERTI